MPRASLIIERGINFEVTSENNKWRVRISVKNKSISIGCFEDLELADLVAQEARDKYHKEFARN